jgi:hypothetical protein
MPRGGKRDGAGRPKGTPNKASDERQQKVAASGQVPLDYMLAIMRDPAADPKRRDAMAIQAAPYVHPKLSAIMAKVETTEAPKHQSEIRDKLVRHLNRIAAAASDTAPREPDAA